ncbi:PhoU domain-containing protein [Kitasatospora sp. CM 4170]|uniref:PhoU domain-containing protein n=1 Tax=Kitasatospora aburaviensis TaxID=67265 RepID=A0ABW1F810_9ACTN|nr:PhoU domain-containing protein [Kitasatospora sp. CM 4170]WNM43358.1 PhoU domain-containing protein [Kitasatospora sp. CM 4170]
MAHTHARTGERLADQADLVGEALRRVTEAVLGSPAVEVGRELEAAERAVRPLFEELEDDVTVVLAVEDARSQDLRELVAEIHIGGDLRHLADQARQIGEIASARRVRGPFPEELRTPLGGLTDLVVGMVTLAAAALREPSAATVADLHDGLNAAAQRQRLLYERIIDEGAAVDPADVLDAVLLAACCARCVHHALSAARFAALFADSP